jgi:hypothetical protein
MPTALNKNAHYVNCDSATPESAEDSAGPDVHAAELAASDGG